MVWRGLSEPNGSWKIICTLAAIRRHRRSPRRAMSAPSSTISPPAAGTSRRIVLPSVDLPQPDSPTSPSVSPRSTSKLTPSTARSTCAADDIARVQVAQWRAGAMAASSPVDGDGSRRPHAVRQRQQSAAAPAGSAAWTQRAARREGAARLAGRRAGAAGDLGRAGRRVVLVGIGVDARAQQPARVGMQRLGEQRSDRRLLDLAAGIHHRRCGRPIRPRRRDRG